MRIQVLLVEDDQRMHQPISDSLGEAYEVSVATSVAAARQKVSAKRFDLVLLDVNLPDGNGFELCQEFKNQAGMTDVPVVLLTGNGALRDRLAGFAAGADDYICKPFEPDELAARVNARTRSRASRFGKLRVDWEMQRAFVKSEQAEKDTYLTPVEFRILAALLKAPQRRVSRSRLLNVVWGKDIHVAERSVDKHVCTLRRKLGDCSAYIRTLPQEGYQFQDEQR